MFAHLLFGWGRVSSEDVVVNTRLPHPQRERALHEHGPARVVLSEHFHLAGALDAWCKHRKERKQTTNMEMMPLLVFFNNIFLTKTQNVVSSHPYLLYVEV